ncbi:transposase family protein [Bulleidia sp. zg-1006]|uniref:transposase family protein n=1 Tax=Bulleidia sp. zg-1006 TaxID=2806552 RepID=UPI00193AA552|nr:transposase family protein [Bulleidia sp. zg-1006]QRG86844.1 transposase [Bulleidia sp. zg-1006]
MINDSISSIIALKNDEVEYCKEVISKKNNKDVHTFHVRLVNHGGRCPKCGTFSEKVKAYRERTIKHSIFLQDTCTIKYSARRFIWTGCHSTFYEDNPFQKQYKAFSDKKVPVSVTTVMSIFDEHVQPERNILSTSIALDVFYFSRKARKKYALMILSLDKGYIIDILPNREKNSLAYMCFHNSKVCVDPFHVLKLINKALDELPH